MKINITITDEETNTVSSFQEERGDPSWFWMAESFLTGLRGHGFMLDAGRLANHFADLHLEHTGETLALQYEIATECNQSNLYTDDIPSLVKTVGWGVPDDTCPFTEEELDWQKLYPLCAKYTCPINDVTRTLPNNLATQWVTQTLCAPWARDFWNIMGPVTQGGNGIYACDVEDTLIALERGYKSRGGF